MHRNSEEKVYDFARLWAVVRARWWVVVVTCLVVGGLAYGASLVLPPRYSATAQIAYSPEQAQQASQALSAAGTSGGVHNIMSDALSMSTLDFAGRVSAALGSNIDPADLLKAVKVTAQTDLEVIDAKVSGADPATVVATANAFADEFVKQRREMATQVVADAQALIQARIDSLTPAERDSAYGAALALRRDDLAVLQTTNIGDYAILQAATTPPYPYFPRPFLNLEIGLVVGLILGVALAVLLDYLDPRIKEARTLERIMDVPVIATVPSASRREKRKSGWTTGIGFGEGHEALLESMRTLRSNLGMLGFGDTKRSLLVTSPAAGEGKSALAVNLALIMALSGRRVVLIDADFRSPTVHRRLGLPNARGLADALSPDGSWAASIQSVDLGRFVSPGMTLVRQPARFLCLTSGPLPSNASEILGSGAMPRMLAEIAEIADYVVVDGPPLIGASDSLVIAQQVDGVVLSSKLGVVTDADAVQAKRLLAQAQAEVAGVVVYGPEVKAKGERSHDRSTTPDGEVWARAT
jgi:capsular exopolysaccharide synthesis family protein